MSSGSKKVVRILPFNRNRRDLLHHMLVPLHPKSMVSIMVGFHNPYDLNAPSVKVVRLKEVTGLLHILGVVKCTELFVVSAQVVISSGVRLVISCYSVQRTCKEMVLAEEKTYCILSNIVNSKRICQMLSLDPGASLSFVTLYVAMNFDVILEQVSKSFSASTPIFDSILPNKFYCDCNISHQSQEYHG